jgi:hypothetical protein
VLQAAVPYGHSGEADGESAESIIIDESALLLGLIADGIEKRQPKTSSFWIVEWFKRQGIEPEALVRESLQSVRASPSPPTRILPSEVLRDGILPSAQRFSEAMTASRDFHLRHLTFALFGELTESSLIPKLTSELLRKLRHDFLNRVFELYPGEREHWERFSAEYEARRRAESVGIHSDAPALIDLLGRQTFAQVLAARVKQVSESLRPKKPAVGPKWYHRWFGLRDREAIGDDAAFILHVDGPWGSGKSSILNFLKKNLEGSHPPWLIVEFNAWRNQQRKPAWWPLIAHVGGTVRRRGWFQFPRARWVWAKWNLRMRWVPLALSTLLIVIFLYFARDAFIAGESVMASGSAPKGSDAEQIGKALDTAVKGVLAISALGGLALTASRSLFMGSKSAAEAYIQSSAEPFRPIVKLFERLVRAIKRPVAVFIDDIDRCDSAYVIELLEGIQTLLRTAPVVYVVAGDRKWICSSFEKRYVDFCGELGAPGRPLGYLFLDKVFQLSTPIPRLSAHRQAEYWNKLLEAGHAGGRRDEVEVRRLEQEAERILKGKTRHEDMQRVIDNAPDPIQQEALRAAVAKQITSPEAIRAAEHRLQQFAPLLEANPRSMKRLVNAYGLNHARAILESRKVSVEALARWTIVELRWPVLANYLAENWTDIADGSLAPPQFPEPIRLLLADSDVREVFGKAGDKGQLTKAALLPILG